MYFHCEQNVEYLKQIVTVFDSKTRLVFDDPSSDQFVLLSHFSGTIADFCGVFFRANSMIKFGFDADNDEEFGVRRGRLILKGYLPDSTYLYHQVVVLKEFLFHQIGCSRRFSGFYQFDPGSR